MPELPLIKNGGSIRECLAVIDRGARGMALVTSSEGPLAGVITDGDIRRGLMRGLPLDTSLSSVLRDHFYYVHEGSSQRVQALQIMRVNKITAVPVLDQTTCR